jgi:hypothetical protein
MGRETNHRRPCPVATRVSDLRGTGYMCARRQHGWSEGPTYEQRERLLELGDLLLGERISLRVAVSGAHQWAERLLWCFAGRGMATGGGRGVGRTMAVDVGVQRASGGWARRGRGRALVRFIGETGVRCVKDACLRLETWWWSSWPQGVRPLAPSWCLEVARSAPRRGKVRPSSSREQLRRRVAAQKCGLHSLRPKTAPARACLTTTPPTLPSPRPTMR